MHTPKKILQKLNERKENNSFRSLHIPPNGIDFYSNDYLGIAQLPFSSKEGHGATGSRLISGNSIIAERLEKDAAHFFKNDTALLFNSGYSANVGLLSCVPQRGDTILYDELCHASIREGIQLSKAVAYKFKHNNIEHLTERLKKAVGETYVVIEGVYSMDGDEADLVRMSQICKENNAFLIVDEAHSGGVYGQNGEGLVASTSSKKSLNVFAKIITFGKAFGSHGSMILGSQELKDYLINFSRPLIYTTALPASNLAHIEFAIDKVKLASEAREKLSNNISFFKDLANKLGISILESSSAIQGVIIPTTTAVKQKAQTLSKSGFMVKAIVSPTVPAGKERIRICLHSYNTTSEIEALLKALK